MSTLQDAIEAVKPLARKAIRRRPRLADQLLGTCHGIIPQGTTSTQFLKALRRSLYGKVPT